MAAPALTWSVSQTPSAAPAPTFTTSGGADHDHLRDGRHLYALRRSTTQSSISFTVTAVVNQTLASIVLSPSACSVFEKGSQQFTAQAFDQFHKAMASAPAIAWSASGGTIGSGGLFTAPAAVGAVTVTAASGTVKGTATATVLPPPTPTVARAITINNNTTVTGKTAALSVLGAETGVSELTLTYTWSVTGCADRREGDLQR